jgi:glycosyltransferase involved in cell wall biosynthesis
MPPATIALLLTAPAWRGSGTSFAKIAAGLARVGWRAVLITAAPGVTGRLRDLGLAVHQLTVRKTGWREVRELAGLLRSCETAMIIADAPRDLRLATLATLGGRMPIIFRYNLSGRTLPGDPVSRLLQRRIAALVYQSDYARERALRTSPWLARVPSHRIPNGYDGARLIPDIEAGLAFRRQHGIADTHPIVLSAAALYRDKGYPEAMEGVARAARARELTWLIAGEGQERGLVEASARVANVPARFLGHLSEPAFAAALNAADVVLHPAPGELFPNIVAEAMARARPVIGLDSGATPELIGRDGRAGLLVPPRDPQALAVGLGSLLEAPDRSRALGREARRRILEQFPLERMEYAYQALAAEQLRAPLVRSIPSPTGMPAS